MSRRLQGITGQGSIRRGTFDTMSGYINIAALDDAIAWAPADESEPTS